MRPLLAALFYSIGRDDLERASISTLTREALEIGWLRENEYEWLNEVRKLRNPIVHFRGYGVQPGRPAKPDWWQGHIEARAVMTDREPYEILEEDAKQAIELVHHLLGTGLMSV